MATGRIVRFDAVRGYGFIAPDGGGEDVFVHASDFDGGSGPVRTGMQVAFKVTEGQRGLKAYDVHLHDVHLHDVPPAVGQWGGEPGVISTDQYANEITAVLISASPAVTAAEIVTVRDQLTKAARARGWLVD